MPGEVRRQHVQLHLSLGNRLLGDFLPSLVAAFTGFAVEVIERVPLGVHDVAQLPSDVVVHPSEVVALQRVLADGGAARMSPLAVAVPETRLGSKRRNALFRSPWYSRSSVISSSTRVGVEVEPDLRAVPAGVGEPRAAMRRSYRTGMSVTGALGRNP